MRSVAYLRIAADEEGDFSVEAPTLGDGGSYGENVGSLVIFTSVEDIVKSTVYSSCGDIGLEFGALQSDESKVVIKMYDRVMVMDHFNTHTLVKNRLLFSEYMDHLMRKFQVEIQCYKRIADYNETKACKVKINVPKVYVHGNRCSLYFRNQLSLKAHYGNYLIVEDIGQSLDGMPQTIFPLDRKIILNAKRQIQAMVESAGVSHNDISLRNLILRDDEIWFIDFGNAGILGNDGDCEYRKELIHKMQEQLECVLTLGNTELDDISDN